MPMKRSTTSISDNQSAYIQEEVDYITEKGIKHLLIDFPLLTGKRRRKALAHRASGNILAPFAKCHDHGIDLCSRKK